MAIGQDYRMRIIASDEGLVFTKYFIPRRAKGYAGSAYPANAWSLVLEPREIFSNPGSSLPPPYDSDWVEFLGKGRSFAKARTAWGAWGWT